MSIKCAIYPHRDPDATSRSDADVWIGFLFPRPLELNGINTSHGFRSSWTGIMPEDLSGRRIHGKRVRSTVIAAGHM